DSIEYGYYVFPLREAGIHLATVTDGVTDWNEVHGRIVAGVMQEGKHQQLLDQSANATRGQLAAMKNGGWAGQPPYGSRLEGPEKARKLVPGDPGRAEVVRRIFREYVEGRSLAEIARGLSADGFVTPSGEVPGVLRRGRPACWQSTTIRGILKNP